MKIIKAVIKTSLSISPTYLLGVFEPPPLGPKMVDRESTLDATKALSSVGEQQSLSDKVNVLQTNWRQWVTRFHGVSAAMQPPPTAEREKELFVEAAGAAYSSNGSFSKFYFASSVKHENIVYQNS